MRQLLTVFHDNIDDMTVIQKRAAIRTVVRKVGGTARSPMWCSSVHRRMKSTGPPSR